MDIENQEKGLKKKVFSGVLWRFAERILAQGISFIVSLVIARILDPSDYGLVSISLIFISIANVFVCNGFNSALIQKKDADDIDFNTVFYSSFAVSLFLYVVLYFSAPIISVFFKNESIVSLIRVFSLILPVQSYKSVQEAIVSKKLEFRKFFFATLGGTIFSAIVGIIMAVRGFGVWALVVQYCSNIVIDSIVLTFIVNWKPKFQYSLKRAKSLLIYGSKVLGADLIGTIFNQLTAFMIGRNYTSADLAYYTKGKQFPDLFDANITSSLVSVLFPSLAIVQDDKEKIIGMVEKTIGVCGFILCPIFIGLAAVADNMVIVFLTEKWIECVPYLQIICISSIISIIGVIDSQLLKAINRSGLLLKLEFIKKPLYLVILLFAMKKGILWLAFTAPIINLIGIIINGVAVDKAVGYSIWRKIYIVIPSVISSIVMGILVYSVSLLNVNPIIELIMQILVGILVYVGCSLIFKNRYMFYLIDILKSRRGKNEAGN